jgi:hypothetical protein
MRSGIGPLTCSAATLPGLIVAWRPIFWVCLQRQRRRRDSVARNKRGVLKPVLRSEIVRTRTWTSRKSLLVVHPHTVHRPKLFPSITASSGQIRNIEVCQRRRAELT